MFHPVFFLISRSCNSLNFFRFMLSEQLRKKCYRAMSGLIFSVEFSSNFRYNYASFWNVAVSLECRKKVVILMLCTICWNNFRRCILFFFIYLLRFHEICSSLISFIKCLISCSSNVNNQSWISGPTNIFFKKVFLFIFKGLHIVSCFNVRQTSILLQIVYFDGKHLPLYKNKNKQ